MNKQAASPDQLEREIVETRAKIDRKLELLQRRLSPRSVAGGVASSVGAQGGAFARNLGAALRDNPVPALLLGIGLVWLILASGRRSGVAAVEDFSEDEAALPPGEAASLAPRTAAAMAAVEAEAEQDRLPGDNAPGLAAGRR